MDVGAHPHMGLQTVTWLLDGELVQLRQPRIRIAASTRRRQCHESGAAIAHAERTPAKNSGRLSGAQTLGRVAGSRRQMSRCFSTSTACPSMSNPGGFVQVFAGTLGGLASPATHHSGIFGGDIQVHRESPWNCPWKLRTNTPRSS